MKRISTDTIARTICLVFALVNQVLAIFGKDVLPFTNDEIYQTVSLVATLITSLLAWWKNNSFTKEAIEADMMLMEERIMKAKLESAKED